MPLVKMSLVRTNFNTAIDRLCKDLELHRGQYGRSVSSLIRKSRPNSKLGVEEWVEEITDKLLEDIDRPIWCDKIVKKLRKLESVSDEDIDVDDIVNELLGESKRD